MNLKIKDTKIVIGNSSCDERHIRGVVSPKRVGGVEPNNLIHAYGIPLNI